MTRRMRNNARNAQAGGAIAPQPTTAARKAGSSMFTMASILADRMSFAARAGMAYNGRRDLLEAIGWNKNPQHADLASMYSLGGVAARIVDAYPQATWRTPPNVYDDSDPKRETKFERDFLALAKKHRLFASIERADKLAQLGRYSVLLLGFTGAQALDLEPGKGSTLIYAKPYREGDAQILSVNTDASSPRYGMPEYYSISMTIGLDTLATRKVHWSRVIHIADGVLESDIYGSPRLRKVFNYLHDVVKVTGGGAEGFWRWAIPALHANISDGVTVTDSDLEKLSGQLDEFSDNLRRYMRTQGVELNTLGAQPADPSSVFGIMMQIISGATGIPTRILLGSERGELASTQDDTNWNDRVMERQASFGDVVLHDIVDRLIAYGAIPAPNGGEYEVEWPDLNCLDDTERADLVTKIAAAANSLIPGGADSIIKREEFRELLGMQPVPEGGWPDEEPDPLPEEMPVAPTAEDQDAPGAQRDPEQPKPPENATEAA